MTGLWQASLPSASEGYQVPCSRDALLRAHTLAFDAASDDDRAPDISGITYDTPQQSLADGLLFFSVNTQSTAARSLPLKRSFRWLIDRATSRVLAPWQAAQPRESGRDCCLLESAAASGPSDE